MPSLADYPTSTRTKVLVIGDSGGGKTGGMVSLLQAGYKLWIVDADGGLDVLVNILKNGIRSIPPAPQLLANVQYETCTDEYHSVGGRPIPKTADAWPKITKAIDQFLSKGLDSDDILVLDSLTFAAQAAMRWILKANGRLAAPAQIQDWGQAMNLTENLVAMLTADQVKCNVICNAHVKYIGNEESGEPVRGYPASLGKELSPKLGRYFNSTLMFRGAGQTRQLHTDTLGNIELKNSNPALVKKSYDISTGLAEYFAAVRGGAPAKTSKAA